MMFSNLSKKQKAVFRWCYNSDYKAVICDGSVRSGKTVCMLSSFILWAMDSFDNSVFALCGKTIRSAERNIIMPLELNSAVSSLFTLSYARSINRLTVSGNGKKNFFYLFGGRDESSYELIQGITLSGVLFDEVALMPCSFVNQAIARTLSVENSKLWFNCNPESPEHWFYKEWILNAEKKNALRIHFTMSDNPVLTEKQIKDAENIYTGVFYDRYIKGEWVAADGLVYPMFDKNKHILDDYTPSGDAVFFISVDYGTLNATSMGLWSLESDRTVRISEYYYNGREKGFQKTDEEYYNALEELADGYDIQYVIVDPSAASFIECIRRHRKFSVRKAKNDVLDGIRAASTLISNDRIFICRQCSDIIREFSLYCWDRNSSDDRPVKKSDHAMDDMRYFVNNVLSANLLKNIHNKEGDKFDVR